MEPWILVVVLIVIVLDALLIVGARRRSQTAPARRDEAPRPVSAAGAALLVAGVLMVAAGQLLRSAEPRTAWTFLPLTAGLVAAGMGFARLLPAEEISTPPVRRTGFTRPEVALLALGMLACGLAAWAAGDELKMRSLPLALGGWTAGLGLLAVGGLGLNRPPRLTRPQAAALAGALTVTLLALPARALWSGRIPVSLSGDEASAGIFALGFLDGSINNLFRTGWFDFPALHNWITSLSIGLLGRTGEALRLPSALAGALAVGSVFLLARSLFGRAAGWAAGVYMAVFHFAVHFSRIGLNNVWDSLTYSLAFLGLWWGWSRGSRAGFALCGLSVGLAQYFYTTGRLLPLLIALAALGLGLRDRAGLRARLPGLLCAAWIAAAAALPINLYFLRHPDQFAAPLNRVAASANWLETTAALRQVSPLQVAADQVARSLGAFTDTTIRPWYDSLTPILLPLPAIMFWLGLAALAGRRDRRLWIPAVWLGGIALTGALSTDTPAGQRYIAAAPALALLVGLGTVATAQALARGLPRLRRVWVGLAALALLAAGYLDLWHYFADYVPARSYLDKNTYLAQVLADRLRSAPPGTQVLFYGPPEMGYQSIMSLTFLLPQVNGLDCPYPWNDSRNPAPEAGAAVYVFLPHRQADLIAARAVFPDAQVETYAGKTRPVLMWVLAP